MSYSITLHFISLRHGVSLNLELTILATLAGQKVPVVLLSLHLIALWLEAFTVTLTSAGDLNSMRHK